jgi:cell division protein FtsL
VPRPAGALLDRLIHGRLWIGLLAFSLIGIVAMQMVVLKLNTDIGRTLTREATLQRENAQLGIEDSMYSAETRVAPLAAAAGMTLAPPGSVHFVQAAPAYIARAASALSQPIQPRAEAPRAGSTQASEASTSSSASEASGSTSLSGEASGSTSPSGEATAAAATTESSGSETSGVSEAERSSMSAGG